MRCRSARQAPRGERSGCARTMRRMRARCNRPLRTMVIAAGLVGLLSGCGLQTGIESRSDLSGGANGRPAPSLHGATLPSGTVDLASERGHPAVIDFWGSWCDPCRAEQPDLSALARRYQARGVRFIGVAMRDQPAAVRAYQQDFKVPYASVIDDGSIAADYDVAAPPTLVIVDSRGRIDTTLLGTVSGADHALDRLLAQH